MDNIKKKVYLDVFASPGTLLPVAGGITAMLAAWATNGNPALLFAGIAGVLVGAGVTATRLVFGLNRITEDAYDHVVQQQRKQQDRAEYQQQRPPVKAVDLAVASGKFVTQPA